MAVTAETRKAIIELVVTAYDAAPGTTLLTELVEAVDGGASLADVATTLTTSSTFKSLYPTFQTTSEFANELLSNLVPSASDEAKAEGVAAIEFVLNSGGTRADVILQAQTFLAGLSTDDATFGGPAAAFQNTVTVATYHTVTLERDGTLDERQNAVSGVDSTAESVTTAQATLDGQSTGGTTTNLTDKIDTVSGTTSNDTVNGIVSDTTSDVTYNVADSIDLGAGTGDTLNVSIINDNNGVSFAGRSAKNVEIVNLKHIDGDDSGQTASFSVASISTPTQVWVKDGSVIGTNDDTVAVTGVSSTATVGVANNDSDLDVTFTTTGSETSGDSITLAVGGGATGDVTINDGAGDGVATINLATSGSASSLSSLKSTDLTTLNISGDQKFTSIGLDSDITTLDASANTAGVTVNANAGSKLKATGSSAADTLSLTVPSSVSAGMSVSAFETVSLYASGSATIDMDQFADVTTYALSSVTGAHGNTLTLQDAPAGLTLNALGAGKSTSTGDWNGVTVNLKDSSGTADSVTFNINNQGVSAGTGDGEIGALTAAGVETVTIAANDFDDLTINNATFAAAKTLNYSGSADTNFGTLSTAALTSFAGGTATGDLTLGTLNNPTVDSTIATGSGKDKITTPTNVSAGKTMTITSGAGDDTITLQDSQDGDGTAGELGTVDLDTGDGDDTVTLTAQTAAAPGDMNFKLDGGAGTQDLLQLTANAGAAGAINIDEFDNFEKINLLGGQNNAIGLAVPTGYADSVLITNVMTANAATITVTAAAGGSASIANWTFLGTVPTLNLNGTTGAETLTGNAGQADNIDTGSGADTVTITDTTDVADTVKVGNTGSDMVTINGFDVGGAGTDDDLELDLSDMEGTTNVTDLVAGDGSSVAAGAHTLLSVTAKSTDIGAAANTILTLGGNYADTDTLETALETGGSLELVFGAFASAGDAILVVYDNGTDSWVATVSTNAAIADGAKATAGSLTVSNYVKLTGVSDATGLVAGDLDNIVA